jgi:hypothetical protein
MTSKPDAPPGLTLSTATTMASQTTEELQKVQFLQTIQLIQLFVLDKNPFRVSFCDDAGQIHTEDAIVGTAQQCCAALESLLVKNPASITVEVWESDDAFNSGKAGVFTELKLNHKSGLEKLVVALSYGLEALTATEEESIPAFIHLQETLLDVYPANASGKAEVMKLILLLHEIRAGFAKAAEVRNANSSSSRNVEKKQNPQPSTGRDGNFRQGPKPWEAAEPPKRPIDWLNKKWNPDQGQNPRS